MHRYGVAALILVLIGSARIISTYSVFNHTIDEPDHLAAGMEWLSTGKYRYEDQHPPLARVVGALGPFLAGERWHRDEDPYQQGYRLLGRDAHYDRTLALGRLGILLFFWIASLVVYLWAAEIGGRAAALIAVLVFTTLPAVLTHSGLITTDMAVTAFTGAAVLGSLRWAREPTQRRALSFGLLLGLAILSKFSAVAFLPAAWLPMILFEVRHSGAREIAKWVKHRRRSLMLVLGTALLTVWAGYLFSFGRVEFLHARLPAPRFFTGLETLFHHNRAGHPSYLFGQRSESGFWYYYAVALALKTPFGFLCTALWTPWLIRRWEDKSKIAMPVLFSAAILAVASMSRINIGVRHVLPVYLGLAVVCGASLAPLFARRRLTWQNGLASVLLIWAVVSGASQHPDYLAYTNELTGSHPEDFLADSDLDWGQDMKRLGEFLKNQSATSFTFNPFNRTYALAGHPLPQIKRAESERPSPGWNAVSITLWKAYGVPAWADHAPQQKRIGRSILIWWFPEKTSR